MEPITVSWSELDAFRQCPKKHDLAYLQRWTKPVESTSALGKGVLWHRILETHYKTIRSCQFVNSEGRTVWGCSYDDLVQTCVDSVGALIAHFQTKESVPQDIIQLLEWMYAGYVEWCGIDDEWDIIEVEQTLIVPISSRFNLKVKIDLMVRDSNGRVWVIDHKSCGNLPTEKDFDWLDQFGLYVAAMQSQGIKVMGSIHSAARTTMNKGDLIKPGDDGYKSTMKSQPLEQRFARTYMTYTEAQLDGIVADAVADFDLAYSKHNHKHRNPNEDWCKWRCPFTEACMFGRRTGKETNVLDMLQRTGFEQDFARH
jgi:hypothetical protein